LYESYITISLLLMLLLRKIVVLWYPYVANYWDIEEARPLDLANRNIIFNQI